jgi:hypothetical protein
MTDAEAPGYYVVADTGRKGAGLFASRDFACGDPIYQFDYWSQPVMPIHWTNHSCAPNAAFDGEGMLRAVRAIAAHEEITFDYLRYPIPASPWCFECACGSVECRGWIDAAREAEADRCRGAEAELAAAPEPARSR